MLKRTIPYAHHLLKTTINQNDYVIDATCGNGNDTAFLSSLVGREGHVYAFDIQKQAIQAAKEKTEELQLNNVTYIHDSHANVNQYVPDSLKGHISGAIFNLGYLPRSDKSIITKSDSTITAIEHILTYLKKKGIIVIVIYYGHEGGKEEKDAVLSFSTTLDQKQYTVLKYRFINEKNNPPFVIAIQKK